MGYSLRLSPKMTQNDQQMMLCTSIELDRMAGKISGNKNPCSFETPFLCRFQKYVWYILTDITSV